MWLAGQSAQERSLSSCGAHRASAGGPGCATAPRRLASISRAWARAITFLRLTRSFLAPDAVSLSTATMWWPVRLAEPGAERAGRLLFLRVGSLGRRMEDLATR